MAAGVKIGEAFIEVSADGKNAFSGLAGEASSAGDRSGGLFGDSFGKGIAKIGGMLAGVFAVAKVTDYIGGAITKASDLNEEVSKSGQIFGASAAQVQTWASTAATNLGMSSLAATQAASNFGNMFTQLGYGSDVAAKMSEDTVQLATDLGSFNNVPTADVADMISASLRGEYDGLQRLIPGITAARVEQEAMAATGKTSSKALTDQEKAAATLAIIHQDGSKAAGDFARTHDGLANSTKITTAKFEDMQASLGTKLMPMASDFMSFLNTNLLPALQGVGDYITSNIVPAIQDMSHWIQDNSTWLVPLVAGIAGLAGALGIASVALGIYNVITAVMEAETLAAAFSVLGLNAALLLNPFTWIVVGIIALIAAIVWVATQTTFFQDAWKVMTDAVGTAWTWLLESVITPVSQFISDAMTVVGDAVTNLWVGFIQPAMQAIGDIFNWIWTVVIMPVAQFIASAIQTMGEVITNVFTVIGAIFQWVYDTFIYPISVLIQLAVVLLGIGISALWTMYVQPTINAIGAIFNWLWVNVISPVFNFISTAIGVIGAIIVSLWTTYVQGTIKAIGDIFNWLWNSVISPVFNWIGSAIGNVGTVIAMLWSVYVQPTLNAIGGAFKWVWDSVISPVATWIGDAIGTVGKTVGDVFNTMADTMKNAFNGVGGIIKGVINGVIDTVNGGIGGINDLIDTANNVAHTNIGKLGSIPHLAKGGTLQSSGIALVGEQGPEIVSLPKGATVHPTGTGPGLDSGNGSHTTNYYVTIDSKNVDDMQKVISVFNNLSQTARTGRGTQNARVA